MSNVIRYCHKCIKAVDINNEDQVEYRLMGEGWGNLKAYYCKDCGTIIAATRYWPMKKELLELDKIKCDIIIPSGKTSALTQRCVDSILQNNNGMDYEITIVDNGSNPKLEINHPKVKILRYEESLYFSKAVNEGIINTKNEWMVILNNDTQIKTVNWLYNLYKCFNHVPGVGIVSPMTNFIAINEARCQSIQELPHEYREGTVIAAVCWFTNRKVFDDIGLFDDQFKNSHDDADMCARLREKGYRMFIDGFTWIHHIGSQSVIRVPGYAKDFMDNATKFKKKWG